LKQTQRTIGFTGATGIGVGAMVGGGILALAGVAFAAAGPSAILAILLNAVIAGVTAMSFAEMAAANPESGGTYNFAKKALTVHIAFGVGWVVWFASLVAAVLYALGFGAFALFALQQIGNETLTALLNWKGAETVLALLALGFYTVSIMRSSGGGGLFANIVKLSVFAILIAGGLAVTVQTPFSQLTESVQPFFAGGFTGLIAAMGFTFIALQGFDLIASASGEIKQPEKTIPKAMIATLIVGLTIYIPLLFVVMTVGMHPGQDIQTESIANPETIIAIAAQNYLGAFGFWFVLIAGIFSMLSALQANVFAASRIALSMARDRTLTHHLAYLDKKTGNPIKSILTTALIAGALILILPDVAAAGAASSLIFLITFALAHGISILLRKRSFEKSKTFKVPLFPYLQYAGMAACLGLALFQAIVVPSAGGIALAWLILGGILFIAFFIKKARVIDASEEALNPELMRLRGLSPLVLVPIANPANAESMVFVANALAPPVVGRVLLLSIVKPTEVETEIDLRLENNKQALQNALKTSMLTGMKPDALTTFAQEPWQEIERVVIAHQCRSLLLGLSSFSDMETSSHLEQLVNRIKCDVVVFRPPVSGWKITDAKKILVPVGGFSDHDALRARVLGSLWRACQPEILFVQILPSNTTDEKYNINDANLKRFTERIIPGETKRLIIKSDNVTDELIRLSSDSDVLILGLGKPGPGRTAFGKLPIAIAKNTKTALIYISHK